RPEPVPVWQALAPKAAIRTGRANARQVALVGRDDELDLLRARLLDVRAGRGADLVTLVGAPGIGKSRLVREAAQAAEGFRWLQGRSIPYGDGLLDFVEHLRATAAEPLFLLCTARPELLERRPGWPPVVELTPLDDDDTRRLLSALLGRDSLPEELEPVVSRVGGNPLFAEEYASAVADGGTDTVLLPDSVHHVIAARLDALAPQAKALVQDAAVVGKVFWSGA